MSEEQLKQLNKRLAKAEELLISAKYLLDLEYKGTQTTWHKTYQEYLQTFKSKP